MALIKHDEEFEEDMKDEIDSVMGLLDKMKEDRQEELISSQSERNSRLERLKRSKQADGRTKETITVAQVESRTRFGDEPVEVNVRLADDDDDINREGQLKRKQETVVAELREKAEIISKSARKGPEDIAASLSRTHNVEDDPETAEYLQKIRGTSTAEEKQAKEDQKVERNVVVVDFPSPSSPRKTSVTVKLNLDMQKSKIALARGAGLQGRRKPTSDHIRRSLVLSDDEEPEDALDKFDADLEEDMDADDEDEPATPVEVTCVEANVSEAMSASEAMIMQQSPVEYGERMNLERRGSFEGLIPRTTPKPRKPAWKSKTYGGVRLPAFAEAMKAGSKSLKKTDTAEKLLTADIVKQAAINKLNRATKEELPEKESEKPGWLVEAEARRKLHDRRRQTANEKIKPTVTESPSIPIRLKKTGSKLLEEDIEKAKKLVEEDDDSKINKIVFTLKPTGYQGEKQSFEPEPAKISFKLKQTGIQLVKPEEPKDETEAPIKATLVKEYESGPAQVPAFRLRHITPRPEPEPPKEDQNRPIPSRLKHISPTPQPEPQTEDRDKERNGSTFRLRHISPKPVQEPKAEPDQELPAPSVRLRHISPRPAPEVSVEDQETPTQSSRLRHIYPKALTKDFDSSPEPELAMKLRLRGKAQPIYPDEEDFKDQIPRVNPIQSPVYEPPVRVIAQSPTSESPIRLNQTPKAYDAPKPIKIVASSDYRERRPLETAKIINQPAMRTTAESTPPLSQTRSTPKHYCKVTPIPNEPTQRSSRGQAPRVYELPAAPQPFFSQPVSPTSSRTFSPPMSPTSKVTAVSQHVASTPGRSVLPAKSNRGRRISTERSKTVVVTGSEVQRIIPGRRTSSSEEPQRHPVRRTSSLEYPRSHVERAADGYLKHAVTVVKTSNVPRKAQTLKASDRSYSPRYAASEEGLPVWKQDMIDTKRKYSASSNGYDAGARSWSENVLSNKENEPRIVTQMEPVWMRELADKKRNSYSSSTSDIQSERMEALERLESKSTKTTESDDEVREVPSFMKEFERKRRMKTRGFQVIQSGYSPNDVSYV